VPRYPDEFKDYLKNVAPIQDVINAISGNVTLSGNNYVANCPFHDDSNPSLMIKPETKTWSCNGCGAGSKVHSRATSSDVYGFIMGYYNYNLGEAIEWLANFLNIALPALDPEQQYKMSQHQWWVEKCKAAQARFVDNLLKNQSAYKYLRNRGLEDLDIFVWGLGFGDDVDQDFMNTKGKITFPIHDYNGEIISFTGRVPFDATVLADMNEKEKLAGKRITPKYDHRWPLKVPHVPQDYIQNHPYPEFDRNRYLYGISQAKSYINQWKSAYLVEGFTDVQQMHKRGLTNTVASLGTNLSEHHVSQLKRAGTKQVILMRDGDDAGLDAMERDGTILTRHNINVLVCPLPIGHDPDSLALSFPLLDDSFSKFLNKRIRTLTQWRVEKVYREKQDDILYHYAQIGEIQESRIEKVVNLLAAEQDPIQLDILTRQYAELFVISYESLKNQVSNVRSRPHEQQRSGNKASHLHAI
jgi:DNA primase